MGVLLAKVVVKVKKWGLTLLRDWYLTRTCDEATTKEVLNYQTGNMWDFTVASGW